jgi:hypothetical protein
MFAAILPQNDEMTNADAPDGCQFAVSRDLR